MRVCITGLGVQSACGSDPDALHRAMVEGRSAVRPLPDDPEIGLQRALVATCPEPGAIEGVPAHELMDLDRVAHFSIDVALQALRAAQSAGAPLPLERMPVVWGCSMGGLSTLDTAFHDLLERRKKRVRPMTVPMAMPSAPAFYVARYTQAQGPVTTLTAACASSALAIGQAARLIARGEAESVITGGTESTVDPCALRAWQATGALAVPDATDAARSCKPFDLQRNGFVVGEGAAALVLESEASAARRGAEVLGWILGFGHTSDLGHISRPTSPSQIEAMRQALEEAGIGPDDPLYLNAHGTATALGDEVEAASIHAVFGGRAAPLPVSSTKALHGHTLGASGALEAIVTLQALRHGHLPGNVHLREPAPQAASLHLLRTVRALDDAAERRRIGVSNSFAFGGINASLVLEARPRP